MKSTIYTHTGDDGTTSLIGGTRIAKSAAQLEAYGTIDELNSFIGLLNTYLSEPRDKSFTLAIQNRLFQIGSCLATDYSKISSSKIRKITDENVKSIEDEIDFISSIIPTQKAFLIPGGCRASALAHVCRTVCRRGERQIYAFRNEGGSVDKELLEYVNRLSDYFFVLSRKVNFENETAEILWNNTCK